MKSTLPLALSVVALLQEAKAQYICDSFIAERRCLAGAIPPMIARRPVPSPDDCLRACEMASTTGPTGGGPDEHTAGCCFMDTGISPSICEFRYGPHSLETTTDDKMNAAVCIKLIVKGDPHVRGIDTHDFRGRNHTRYCFLSAKTLVVNGLVELMDYLDAGRKRRRVKGSFFTTIYVHLRTDAGTVLSLEFSAKRAAFVSVGVDDTEHLTAYKAPLSMSFGDVTVALAERKLKVTTPEWLIGVSAKVKPTIIGEAKGFVEVAISPLVDVAKLAVAPHGLIGQSYDGDDIGVIGKTDDYKPDKDGVITTSAMGEGAIEGVAADYEVASKFATDFKYSRWGKTEAKPRDVSQLTGQKVKIGADAAKAAAVATELE